ncbi:MAG TPA: low affinity iron permease family protein [Nitrososphaera sp.]|nr:low affinity iron permease family protein [Nitrososphaera sp.]
MARERQKNGMGNRFQTFATRASYWVGSRWSFVGAMFIIIAWAAVGPYFRYSDTWQLVVNTATTIVTFLMVFLIQNTQNRDARAIHLKLDEIIRAIHPARNEMINIEKLSDDELEMLSRSFERIRMECESRKEGNATTKTESHRREGAKPPKNLQLSTNK